MARQAALCALVLAFVGAAGGGFAASAWAQTRHAEALTIGSATVALPAPSDDFPTESWYVNSNLGRLHRYSSECVGDGGHLYRWRCTRSDPWD